MAGSVRRSGRRLALLIGALGVAACSATTAPPAQPAAPVHPTAAAACMAALGNGWQVTVEVDGAESSALALTNGDSIATCETGKNAERTGFESTATGVGLHPATSPPALTYLGSGGPGDKTSYLVGRVPPTASTVQIAFDDGSEQTAVLGGGLWLASLEEPHDTAPIAIEALDAAGTVISRLDDSEGLQPAS